MKECTGTDKPLISILMAVYNPNIKWLREQLISLNEQTYPNLELHVMDDCSTIVTYEDIYSCITECVNAFSYYVYRNEQNIGSNKAFEKLTGLANGKYIAYCDQDDVWLPEKIETLYSTMAQGVTLSYSDMIIINDEGERIADSLCEIRPRLHYVEGANLSTRYLFQNCTAGCCLLVESKVAKKAIPFPDNTVYDQWVCIISALYGVIKYTVKPLLMYRQHHNNQTGILTNIRLKKDYYDLRVNPLVERFNAYKVYMIPSAEVSAFVEARKNKRILGIWKYRNLCKKDAQFEVAMRLMPEFAFRIVIKKARGR